MSGRILPSRLAPLTRRGLFYMHAVRRSAHQYAFRSGGLLRSSATLRYGRRRAWPFGAYAVHNVPAVRTISFARVLPQLAMKLVRIPAMFGGAMIAGLVYLQYQATRMLLSKLDFHVSY